LTKRTGSSRRADIPADVLAGLNAGRVESATLAEGLAVDFATLLRTAFPELTSISEAIDPAEGITRRMRAVGESIAARCGRDGLSHFIDHRSDTVRGWAAYAIAALPGLTLAERLNRIQPLADDSHFGVREWAWCALREAIAADVSTAIDLLTPWTRSASANVRRFAAESTRPRGVWCAHILLLKETPELGLPILEPLRADPAKYVRDSVANWLNDASKTRPDWVRQLGERWRRESPTPETEFIVTRALRTLKKKG
jgi:3-methyladenine DNA glycosylase AlkC